MINFLFILSFLSSWFVTMYTITIPYDFLIIINVIGLFTITGLFISLYTTSLYPYLLVIWFNINQIIVFTIGSSIVSILFNLITIGLAVWYYFYSK